MELTGKVIAVFDAQSGTSKAGKEWQKREFVIETQEQYAKKVCFTLFNKVELCPNVGEVVSVSFDIDANEYKGKWYNSVNAWKVNKPQQQTAVQTSVETAKQAAASDNLPI